MLWGPLVLPTQLQALLVVGQAGVTMLNPVCEQGLDPLAVFKQLGPAETWFLYWSTPGSSGASHIVWVSKPTSSRREMPPRERGRLLSWVSTHRGPPGIVRC